MQNINCWDFMKCGRGPGGEKIEEFGICPAAENSKLNGMNGGINGGRICWFVSGTLCDGKEQSVSEKHDSCMKCEFYELVKGH